MSSRTRTPKTARRAPKPSEIASDNKRNILHHCLPYMLQSHLTIGSHLIEYSPDIHFGNNVQHCQYPERVIVTRSNPTDFVIEWQTLYGAEVDFRVEASRMLLVNTANENRAGGDWESSGLGPEECLARRSNLAQQLQCKVGSQQPTTDHYPIPTLGGIYTHNAVIFRHGPGHYQRRETWPCLSVVSVAPVRRPKVNSESRYSFEQERDLMQEKIRTVLKIAALYKHRDICIGAFGTGQQFKNPLLEVVTMWRHALFEDPELRGLFRTVVFAIEDDETDTVYEAFEKYLKYPCDISD